MMNERAEVEEIFIARIGRSDVGRQADGSTGYWKSKSKASNVVVIIINQSSILDLPEPTCSDV